MARPINITLTPFNQFLLVYGIFLSSWNSFEVLIEVLIRRQLRLTVEETCIVTAGLGFGAKANILLALLNRTEEGKAGAALISEAQRIAERNSFAHSFLSVDQAHQYFTQVRREVRGALTVRTKKFSPELMEKHKDDFFAKWVAVQEHFNVMDGELAEYQQGIESLEKAPQAPASPRPESPTSSRPSRQTQRAEQRAQNQAAKKRLWQKKIRGAITP